MSNFEWQTEEIAEWPEAAAVAPGPESPSPFRWLTALVVVLLVAALGWLLYRQAEQRIAEATARMEADVLSAHRLVRQAEQQRDVELFVTSLSGRDRRWTETQKALVEGGFLFDAAAFGFQAPPVAADFPAAAAITVTLSADLAAAELTWPEPFIVNSDRPATETATLLQTAVYRRGERSWLLAPPEREFWGDWQEASGAYVNLVYPRRDEPVARRLVHDLDAVVAGVCTQLDGLLCPAGLALRLRLETDAGSLLAIHDAATMIMSGRSLHLPTPTLVGLPLDEAGYQALARGYGAHVAAALITDLVDYDCCRHGLFYRALLDTQLSRLGLRPLPAAAIDYDQLLANPYSLSAGGLWGRATLDWLAADEQMALYSLAEFVLAEVAPATTIAGLQQTLGQPVSFNAWLARLAGVVPDPPALDRAWLHFIYRQSPSGHADLSIPPPSQTLQLECSGGNEGVWLYGYDWDSGQWHEGLAHEHGRSPAFSSLYSLPGKDRYVLQEQFVATNYIGMRLSVRQDGREIFALEQAFDTTSSTYGPYFAGHDPSGRYLALAVASDRREPPRYQLVDLASCDSGNCRTYALSGWLQWSPDGRQTLLEDALPVVELAAPTTREIQPSLYRGDARGQSAIPVGTGFLPFWLDNDTYGYLRRAGGREVEMVTAVAGEDTPRVLLQSADLLPLIAAGDRPELIAIDRAMANPSNPRQVLAMARIFGDRGRYTFTFFLLELAAGFRAVDAVAELLQTERPAWSQFSPDGRWLAIGTWNTNGRDGIFHLIDLESGERQSFSGSGNPLSWSADGQWLAQPEEGFIFLRAPSHDYKQLILHDFADCYSVHWGNRD